MNSQLKRYIGEEGWQAHERRSCHPPIFVIHSYAHQPTRKPCCPEFYLGFHYKVQLIKSLSMCLASISSPPVLLEGW